MNNSTPASVLLVVTFIFALALNGAVSQGPKEAEEWLETLRREKRPEKMTKLHFYFHDLFKGKNVTSATMAEANVSSPVPFGKINSADDPLTVGPEFTSKRVGYLKGLYATTSLEEVELTMAMSFVFTDGIYNGSSLSVLGQNPHQHQYREVAVVGGSGRFRLARGVASLKTYYFNFTQGNSTVEVDIVLFHY